MRSIPMPSPRSRHPLARALTLLVSIALASVMAVFGLVMAGVLLIGGGLLLALRHWNRTRAAGRAVPASRRHAQVLEGDFVVLHDGPPAAR